MPLARVLSHSGRDSFPGFPSEPSEALSSPASPGGASWALPLEGSWGREPSLLLEGFPHASVILPNAAPGPGNNLLALAPS